MRLGGVPRSHLDDANNIINNDERYSRPAKRAIQRGEEENKEQRKKKKKNGRRNQSATKKIDGQAPLTSYIQQTQEASNRKKREDK